MSGKSEKVDPAGYFPLPDLSRNFTLPDLSRKIETRRRQQEEAALRRQQQSEGRGVKDPERLKRQQKRKEDAEKEALKQGPSEGGLKWTVG
ncbi:small VCP/p97-interacting protein-like isoform X2 [Montipora foliosa]|uniref:small VCP/p97-interacting protein-like isoform X2 n=1 Tax=Montipora foliosa TaxID=591990 RepID=UPI0035F1FCC7